MAKYEGLGLSSATEYEALAAAQIEHNRNHNVSRMVGTADVHRKVQVDTHADGRVVTKDMGPISAAVEHQLRPGHIIIPGLGETTIEAARAAGLLPPGFEVPAGAKSPVAAPAGNIKTATAPEATPDAVSVATDAAATIIETLSGTHGADAVSNGIWNVAESGNIEDHIPEGVTTEHVETLVAGFVSQANAVLGAIPGGAASVDMLTETLTDAELKEARTATITNDKAKLAHFGKLALGRIEALPDQNPQAFEDLIADMPAKERKALTFNEDRGEWVVTIPGRQAMSFGLAVRSGLIRVG